MKTLLLLIFVTTLSTITTLAAGPSIASPGVYNSASYALSGFPNGGIAQGSIFVVFGSGLGPSTIAYNSSLPYQTTLSGTSVNVTVSGTTVACLMFYTSAGQIAAILPSTTPAGTGTITVTYNGATSPTAPITVVKNALGLFARNQQGSGPAVIQDPKNNYNSLTNAFQPGETVTFWGTGLGPISGSDATTPPSGNLPGTTVTANIGGQSAVVQYAGRSGYAGEDQINITVPSGVSGCYVPVYVSVNGVASNFVSMSITSSGAVCSDATLYTSIDLQNIANGGSLRTGNLILTEFGLSITIPGLPISIPPEESETGSGSFLKYDANTFLSSLGGLSTLATSVGSCSVFQFSGSQYVDPVQPAVLDAGAQINVTGPNGTKTMPKTSGGNYQGTFASPSLNPLAPPPTKFLTPGTYTLDNGTGGADIGPFKTTISVPTAVTWSNKASVNTVPRTQPLTITWTGGTGSALVYVIGESPLAVDASGTFQGAGEFVCVAQGSAGSLTVPAAILSALPPSANISESGITVGGGLIIVNETNTTSSTVAGLDVFLAGASSGDGKIGVTFQ